MRRFRDFLREAAAPATPKGSMPTPAPAGVMPLPSMHNPPPITGFSRFSDLLHHQQLEQKPEMPVLTSFQRIVYSIYSNPGTYSLNTSSFTGNVVMGIPMKMVVSPTSLSLGGDGKVTGSQFEKAKEMGFAAHPSRASGLTDPNEYFDLDVSALQRQMYNMQMSMQRWSTAANAADNTLDLMNQPGQGAQQLQRAANAP